MKKYIIIVLVIVVVGVIISVMFKDKFMKKDLVTDFNKFFVELNKHALAGNKEFVSKTVTDEYVAILEKLRKMDRESIVQKQIRNLKEVNLSNITYSCRADICTAQETIKDQGPEYTVDWSYKNSSGNWILYFDNLPTIDQVADFEKLQNNYQLSLYGNGQAEFTVFVNDQEVKAFSMTEPEKDSKSSLLPIKTGENVVSIKIVPKSGATKVVYAYDIYEFPKGNESSDLIMDDQYKLFSSTPQGKITGFIETSKEENLNFEINAK